MNGIFLSRRGYQTRSSVSSLGRKVSVRRDLSLMSPSRVPTTKEMKQSFVTDPLPTIAMVCLDDMVLISTVLIFLRTVHSVEKLGSRVCERKPSQSLTELFSG